MSRESGSHFTPDAGWLRPHASPRKPSFVPPPGAVDAHCHVFGPGDDFPYAPERKYTPSDAPKEALFALRDHLGFERNVIVQGTCHGADNRALVDALRASNDRARGVATVRRDVTDAELTELHDAGVRGVRFNFVKRLVDVTPPEVLLEVAETFSDMNQQDEARFLAAKVLTTIPDCPLPDVQYMRGRAALLKGETAAASAALLHAQRLDGTLSFA